MDWQRLCYVLISLFVIRNHNYIHVYGGICSSRHMTEEIRVGKHCSFTCYSCRSFALNFKLANIIRSYLTFKFSVATNFLSFNVDFYCKVALWTLITVHCTWPSTVLYVSIVHKSALSVLCELVYTYSVVAEQPC